MLKRLFDLTIFAQTKQKSKSCPELQVKKKLQRYIYIIYIYNLIIIQMK